MGEARGVHAPEQGLDVVRVFPRDVALEGVLDHPARDVAGEGDAVALPDPLDAVVGGHLHDDPERPADTIRRDGRVRLDVRELHGVSPASMRVKGRTVAFGEDASRGLRRGGER